MRLHLNLDGVALCCVLFLRVSGFVQQKHALGQNKATFVPHYALFCRWC